MGTSGLLGFVINGKLRVTYVHFDSYPGGLGVGIASFITEIWKKKSKLPRNERYKAIAERVQKIKWVEPYSKPPKDLRRRYSEYSKGEDFDWYHLLQKMQGHNALYKIQKGTLEHMTDHTDENDYHEWAYYIDFEKMTLETWKENVRLRTVAFGDLVVECKESIAGVITKVI